MKLFVYGTLKRGLSRSKWLGGQQFLTEARTAPIYRMYRAGSYPALVPSRPGLEIEGELWEVSDACLTQLDKVEGVPEWFDRRAVQLVQPREETAEAYLYQQPVDRFPECGACWQA